MPLKLFKRNHATENSLDNYTSGDYKGLVANLMQSVLLAELNFMFYSLFLVI